MHATTFGAFPAAEELARLLEARGDAHLSRKVSSLLQDFNEGLAHLAAIGHPGCRKRLALLWRDDFLSRVDLAPDIDKFIRNVLHTRAKDLLGPET
ncbi:MAG: hypothetical protein K2W96_02480 [Gemmataceae bacterium]|nr:hypothetical protein [Gemmataceae bacterium]